MPDEFDAIIAAAMPDETEAAETVETKVVTEKAPEKKPAKETKKENFDEAEYENEDDENFDPDTATPEQRKAWPKKYANALSRRDKERTKYKAELADRDRRLAELEAKFNAPKPGDKPTVAAPEQTKFTSEQQARVDAVAAKQPQLKDFSDWGKYNEAFTDWKIDLREIKREILQEVSKENDKATADTRAADTAVETKIVQQAKELIQKNPEYLNLVQENADLIDNMPAHVTQAFAKADNAAVAFIVLAKTEGALQALAKMDPISAAQYIAKADFIGQQQLKAAQAEAGENDDEPEQEKKKVSGAPLPITKVRTSTGGGKKSLDKMNDDELFKELGI